MPRNGTSMILGSLAVAIAGLALCSPAYTAEKSKKPAQAESEKPAQAESGKPAKPAAEEATAPEREIPPAAERAQRLTDRMKEQLGLTEEQVPRVAEINLSVANKVDAIRAESAGNSSERSEKVRSVQNERDRELKKVLTKEQWVKYKSMQDELRAKGRDGAKGYRKQGGGEPIK